MAKATGNMRTIPAVAAVPAVPEREELESVTLTLTPREAGLLGSMLGSIVGPSGESTPRYVWAAIYHVLAQVKGVNWPTHGGYAVKIVRQMGQNAGEPVTVRLEWRDH